MYQSFWINNEPLFNISSHYELVSLFTPSHLWGILTPFCSTFTNTTSCVELMAFSHWVIWSRDSVGLHDTGTKFSRQIKCGQDSDIRCNLLGSRNRSHGRPVCRSLLIRSCNLICFSVTSNSDVPFLGKIEKYRVQLTIHKLKTFILLQPLAAIFPAYFCITKHDHWSLHYPLLMCFSNTEVYIN